jgi:hypothetical protein
MLGVALYWVEFMDTLQDGGNLTAVVQYELKRKISISNKPKQAPRQEEPDPTTIDWSWMNTSGTSITHIQGVKMSFILATHRMSQWLKDQMIVFMLG